MSGRLALAVCVAATVMVAPALADAKAPPKCFGKTATIVRGDRDNTIVGTEGNDVIVAGRGRDEVHGGNGDDRICGGAGNDELSSSNGNSRLSGGAGSDTLAGGIGDNLLNGGADSDYLTSIGYAAGDEDHLIGGRGNDEVEGTPFDDRLQGGDGNDELHGSSGEDVILGNDGKDELLTEDGEPDRLNGGQKRDRCDIDPFIPPFGSIDDAKSCEVFFDANSARAARTAARHDEAFRSRVEVAAFEFKFDRFAVWVRSGHKPCKAGRLVVLWKNDPGDDERIGQARTERDGIAQVDAFPAALSTYYARAKRKVIRPGRARRVCRADRSPGFVLEENP